MDPVVWELAKAGAEAGLSAYEHRSALSALWARLTRKTYRIAVTGAEGAGKSVLVDYLQGEGFKPGYQTPGVSLNVERDRVVWPRKCLSLSTLPGQQRFAQRMNALQEVFDVGDPLDGVIHVVANGFLARERLRWPDVAAQEGLASLTAYTSRFREEELDDLRQTAALILWHWTKHHKPLWLVIAVGKVDLYAGAIDGVRGHYEALEESPFVRVRDDLHRAIGLANLNVVTVPLCTELASFDSPDGQVRSQLTPRERDVYFAQFCRVLEGLCHG